MEDWFKDDVVPKVEIEKLTLCRDDFIEWVLRSTNEDSEFRIYNSRHYIQVGIDKSPVVFE